MKIKELKQELKKLASLLRESKHRYKECQRGNTTWDDFYKWSRETGIASSSRYRHLHIAYCLLRGKKYEQIENKVKEGNEPTWATIEYLMKEYGEAEEIACAEVVNV